jgi:hypothetical protein
VIGIVVSRNDVVKCLNFLVADPGNHDACGKSATATVHEEADQILVDRGAVLHDHEGGITVSYVEVNYSQHW